MPYQEKIYAIVIAKPGGDKHLFGRVRRSPEGDVYVIWAEDQSPRNLGRGSNPHASYHASGRLHSKTYRPAAHIRTLQVPGSEFRGNQPIEVTNANRALSATLPPVAGRFDDAFEISSDLVTGNENQWIAVEVIEPGVPPVQVTQNDTILAKKVFKDEVPWIVVRLGQSPPIP